MRDLAESLGNQAFQRDPVGNGVKRLDGVSPGVEGSNPSSPTIASPSQIRISARSGPIFPPYFPCSTPKV
jgi:hypothetical protein